jgi:sugar/nucleoside kinase (ribokinase family)
MRRVSRFDVYAFGVVSPSTLYVLRDPFPRPDGYAEIERVLPSTGGEAGNGAIVLSRLGLSVRLDGSWIADTAAGRGLLERLLAAGIDTSRLRVRKRYAGVTEFVVSDSDTRTVFGTYASFNAGPRGWNVPRRRDVAAARIVLVDPPFREESEAVGRYASELGVPFVSLDSPPEDALARDAAAVAVSGEFRSRACPDTPLEGLFRAYQARARGLVVLTDGAREILYGRRGGPIERLRPFRVESVDTTGAGDAFRAGLAYGLLQGWDDRRVVEAAAALAALVCTSLPGVLRSPSRAALSRFLRRSAHGG